MSATTFHEQAGTLLLGATLWLGPQAIPQAAWMHCVDGHISAIGSDNTTTPDARYRREMGGCQCCRG